MIDRSVKCMSLKSYPRLYFELLFAGFTIVMGMGLVTSFLPIFADDLDPSGVLVGLTVSAFFLSRLFIELPAGIISDRIGRRKLLIMGIALSAFGAFLCSQATISYVLILGRAVWGLGTALYFMNNAALVIDLFNPEIRGRALGLFNGIEFLGGFIGAPIGAFLAGILNYTNVFYFTLVLVLSSFGVALSSKSLKAFRSNQARDSSPSLKWTLTNLKNWSIFVVCTISFFRMLIMQGIFGTVFQLYLNKDLLFPLEYIGLIMAIRTGGHIVATVSSGFLSDRFGRRLIVAMGFLIDAGCLAAFTAISSLDIFLAVGFLEGLGEGLVFTSLIVLLSDIAHPSAMGGALGFYRTFMDLGGFIGPMAFMLIYSSINPSTAFLVAIGINIMNIILLTFIRTLHSTKKEVIEAIPKN